jgi:hypothetical protein
MDRAYGLVDQAQRWSLVDWRRQAAKSSSELSLIGVAGLGNPPWVEEKAGEVMENLTEGLFGQLNNEVRSVVASLRGQLARSMGNKVELGNAIRWRMARWRFFL